MSENEIKVNISRLSLGDFRRIVKMSERDPSPDDVEALIELLEKATGVDASEIPLPQVGTLLQEVVQQVGEAFVTATSRSR